MDDVLGYRNFCMACANSRMENGEMVCRGKKSSFYGLPVKSVLNAPCIEKDRGMESRRKHDVFNMRKKTGQSGLPKGRQVQTDMNRNKKGVMPQITRETYKRVKKYDRQQFADFCTKLYGYGYEDGMGSIPGISAAEIMEAVSMVKGIGVKKMEHIRAAVESVFEGGGKNDRKASAG